MTLHLLIILGALSCSRYAPLTHTKIKVSGIRSLTANGSDITLNGLIPMAIFSKNFQGNRR